MWVIQLHKHNPDALLLEPREVYDNALVGITSTPADHWPRTKGTWVAVYDSDKCIEAIAEWLQCGHNDAADWFSFNTSGAWVGDGTPTFRS